MNKILLALSMTALTAIPAIACDENGSTGIVEDNSLWIGPEQKSVNSIDEATFNKVISDIEKIYAPIVRGLGGTLQVVRNWSDGTVNAFARRLGTVYEVQMFGGLARHETITADGFALVVCHEIGHHIGGAPKKASWFGSAWASNEGQADYWGNLKCMREYMEEQDNVTIVADMQVDPVAAATCEAQFADANEIAICKRGAMAGLSLANLFRALRQQTVKMNFDTPDRNIVDRTNDNHPDSQCRLDTYYAGSICTVAKETEVSNTDATLGTCNTSTGQTIGYRPLCWYKAAR